MSSQRDYDTDIYHNGKYGARKLNLTGASPDHTLTGSRLIIFDIIYDLLKVVETVGINTHIFQLC